jgi:hypothetical protein
MMSLVVMAMISFAYGLLSRGSKGFASKAMTPSNDLASAFFFSGVEVSGL